jgi:multisubunit Na+/H+ antiporter MnhB subunit
MLELVAIALGLALLQQSKQQTPAKYNATGAWVLIGGGLVLLFITGWYWWAYYAADQFNYPEGMRPNMTDRVGTEDLGRDDALGRPG